MRYLLMLLLVAATANAKPGFTQAQLRYSRVRAARANTDARLRTLFAAKNIPYPPARLFMRAFKADGEFELWAAASPQAAYQLVKTYPICASSGTLGPKRRRGDGQVPEGFYRITAFNPNSAYHVGMLVSYPNDSDRARKSAPNPGGAIMVHGDCVTIGCIPLTDGLVEEVYWLTVQVYGATGRLVPIHIFPTRLTDERLAALRTAGAGADLLSFWRELQPGYLWFEQHRRVPRVAITADGRYRIVGTTTAAH